MFWMMAMASADPGAFAGTWVFSGGEPEKAKVEAVVEAGAQRFNFAIRPIARGKIRKVAAIDTKIVITGEPGKVVMDYSGGNARISGGPSDGTPVDIRGSKVTFKMDGKKLSVDGKSDDGGKLAVYTITGDNTMSATYSVISSSLGPPALTWTLSYKKQ